MSSSAWRTSPPGASARARPARGPVAPPPDLRLDEPWAATRVLPSSPSTSVVQRWMSAPHVVTFWQQDWPLADWEREIAAQHDGRHSRPWLVSRDGEPVAYVEVYRAAIDLVSEWFPVDEHDVGVHLAIGDEHRIGRGLGTALLRAVASAVFAVEPGCRRVLGDPDATNVAARRAFAAAGFAPEAEVELPHKRATIMVLARPDAGERTERPA